MLKLSMATFPSIFVTGFFGVFTFSWLRKSKFSQIYAVAISFKSLRTRG